MPFRIPRHMFRLARRQANRALQAKVDLKDIPRGLGRALDNTLDLIPLDSDLLMAQGEARTRKLNRQLAWSLAFVAGAVNAGGYLAVDYYTSHVSGSVSRAADEFALGDSPAAFTALAIVGCFGLGAFVAGLLMSFAKRRRFRSQYALSLMLEAVLMMIFGFSGYRLHEQQHFYLPLTVILLSFMMGMHNSVVTTISNAEVRTTHMTGIITDLGVELSRLFYWNLGSNHKSRRIVANKHKLKLHGLILVSFFGGGLVGALSFKHIGFKMTVPLAAFLVVLAWRPIFHDLRVRWRLMHRHD